MQAPNPKSSIIRTEISDVSQSHSFPDKSNCICVTTKSHDKWYLVANSEVRTKITMHVSNDYCSIDILVDMLIKK